MSQNIGRSIRLFFVNGAPNGLMIAEIVNWTGKVIVVPSAALLDFIGRDEAKNTAVYVIAGSDPNDPYRQTVYVGQSDEVGKRLLTHDKDETKNFERAIVFISKDKNLTKSHVCYLESQLSKRIISAGRARSLNGNNPGGASLPEADISDMEFFLQQIQLVLPVLGLDILMPMSNILRVREISENISEDLLNLNSSSATFVFTDVGTSAEAIESNGEFVVLANSQLRVKETPTIPPSTKALRKNLLDDGGLIYSANTEMFTLTKDIAFRTPSGAGAFICGGNNNGRLSWKLKETGETYADWREKTLMTSLKSHATSDEYFDADNLNLPQNE